MISKKVLQEAAKRLVSKFQPERIILFGSYARGTADEHSDADILVICPVKKDRIKLMVEMDSLLEGLEMARDIVILTPREFEIDKEIPGTIARYAYKEGRLLYERKQERDYKENKRVAGARR
jgi:predicted nucleotidyltransferase